MRRDLISSSPRWLWLRFRPYSLLLLHQPRTKAIDRIDNAVTDTTMRRSLPFPPKFSQEILGDAQCKCSFLLGKGDANGEWLDFCYGLREAELLSRVDLIHARHLRVQGNQGDAQELKFSSTCMHPGRQISQSPAFRQGQDFSSRGWRAEWGELEERG